MYISLMIMGSIIVILLIQLICLKRAIRKLRTDFARVRKNNQAQQNLCLTYPEKQLELLAAEINDAIGMYYEAQAGYQQNVRDIRKEITNLSHDLRTPLTSILGYMELMNPEELNEEQQKIVEVVKRRGNQLNDLIEQLYEYARLENQEYALRLEKLDLYRIVKEHVLEAYLDFEKAGIELQIQLPKEAKPLFIQGDRKGMERVLENLTSNTVKYCGSQAVISLKEEASKVVIMYQTPRGELSEFDVAHLFERFYKKDTARVEHQSSGLGLTIAKLLVEQMGGTIYAKTDQDSLFLILNFPKLS